MSGIEVYQGGDKGIHIEVPFEKDNVWLTQEQMALLFDKNKMTISEHISNIFREGELDERMVVRDFLTTTQHGAIPGKTQNRNVRYYSLDVIISVVYRIKSKQGTQFRIWATQRLKEHLVQGHTINQKCLNELQSTI